MPIVLLSGLSAAAATTLMTLMFWTHIITQLVFLNVLPTGKHFHVITALPNVFLKSLGYPHEKAQWLDLEDEDAWENESLGINHIHQLNWKQGLDLYTCTECGRCKEVCPTYTTEKPLNLHEFRQGGLNRIDDDGGIGVREREGADAGKGIMLFLLALKTDKQPQRERYPEAHEQVG